MLGVLGNIPGDMQGDRSTGAVQRMQQPHVFNFFFQITGLSADGETPKAGASRAQGPAGNRDLQLLNLCNQVVGLQTLVLQICGYLCKCLLMPAQHRLITGLNLFG